MAKKKNEPLRQRTKLEFVRVESPKFKSWEDLCNGAKDGRHLLVHTDSMCSFGYYLCTNGQEEYGKRETQTGNYYGELIDEYLRSHFIGGNRDRNFPNKLAITIETVCKDTKDRPIRRSKGKPKPLSLEEEFNEWYAQNRRIYGEYDDFVERERGRCEGSCRHQYD